jgi:hypothetical protein
LKVSDLECIRKPRRIIDRENLTARDPSGIGIHLELGECASRGILEKVEFPCVASCLRDVEELEV